MATQATSLTPTESKRRKAALESKLRDLPGVSREREVLEIEYFADPIDQVKLNTDQEITVQCLDRQARLTRDIQSALFKIETGAYGRCERCEESIPPKRLDAVPWARLCAACQSEAEVAGQDGKAAFEYAL